MPSDLFWIATMFAGPRRRVAPQCLQYTENMAGLRVWSDATTVGGADLGRVLINRTSPAFQLWSIRTNPVMITFDYER
jgi:hypothetical protein